MWFHNGFFIRAIWSRTDRFVSVDTCQHFSSVDKDGIGKLSSGIFLKVTLSSLSLEDDITVFPAGDNFICERVAKCKFDITLEHDIMVLSLRKKIIRLKLTLAFFQEFGRGKIRVFRNRFGCDEDFVSSEAENDA